MLIALHMILKNVYVRPREEARERAEKDRSVKEKMPLIMLVVRKSHLFVHQSLSLNDPRT